ncbi:hypothetical protein [Streptomyces sp. CC208A]|uniref:hypothetical protein n=1 Tax=Streptomyces sp. CC208A TaxID=3044573 RepID=UPI0024A92434|nr:hypothetical protein [Streptomyces sp. CC208A]
MAIRPKFFVVCDGCGVFYEDAGGHDNGREAEIAAYTAGWRVIARQKTDGSPSKQTNNVCPQCLPDWQAKPATDTWANRRR